MALTTKLSVLGSTLHQSVEKFNDIVKDIEALSLEGEDYKRQLIIQKEKCDSQTCPSSEALKKIVGIKDSTLTLLAATFTKFYETKDLSIINEAYSILFEEPPKIKVKLNRQEENKLKIDKCNLVMNIKEEFSINDLSIKDESASEIEATPGRTSPIIHTKKQRNATSNQTPDLRDKKKSSDSWSTPESKAVKLIYTTPSRSKSKAGPKQSRLNFVKQKPNTVVDLTSSPELMSGRKCSQDDYGVQRLIKKESTDNEETILPSPTSGAPNFPSLLKTRSKCSPFKKPPLCLKHKSENKLTIDYGNAENVFAKDTNEDSINLLKPNGLIHALNDDTPISLSPIYDDETHCITSSLSILQQVESMEQSQQLALQHSSPAKRPLVENINIVNTPPDTDSSISLLRRESGLRIAEGNVKRKVPEEDHTLYKEPAVRKKTEKRALPGWSCDQCRIFYDELYQNDPDMLAKKMDECSKHRAKRDPTRPLTPGGFWNPRWSVPTDTEEFNRRNNAI